MSDQIPVSLCMFFIILHNYRCVISLIFGLVISNIKQTTNKTSEEENLAYDQNTTTVQQLILLPF